MKNSPRFHQFLIVSNLFLLGLVTILGLTAFKWNFRLQYFNEINVERINVIGESGKPVLVISNKRLMPGPTINNKTYPREVIDGRDYMSGLLFFNELGDEVGSIIYAGIKKDSSGYSAVGHLSFDQWHQNQVLALDYNDKSGNRYAGMRIWDRPTTSSYDTMLDLMAEMKAHQTNPVKTDSIQKLWKAASQRGENGVERLFVGSKNEVAQILLKDKKGNVRARMYVNEEGEAKLEFLNMDGEKIASFPN